MRLENRKGYLRKCKFVDTAGRYKGVLIRVKVGKMVNVDITGAFGNHTSCLNTIFESINSLKINCK